MDKPTEASDGIKLFDKHFMSKEKDMSCLAPGLSLRKLSQKRNHILKKKNQMLV